MSTVDALARDGESAEDWPDDPELWHCDSCANRRLWPGTGLPDVCLQCEPPDKHYKHAPTEEACNTPRDAG